MFLILVLNVTPKVKLMLCMLYVTIFFISLPINVGKAIVFVFFPKLLSHWSFVGFVIVYNKR